MKPCFEKIQCLFRCVKIRVVIATLLVLLGLASFRGWGDVGSNDFNLNITRSGDDFVLSWSDTDVMLQSSQTLNGDWLDMPEATSPLTVAGNLGKEFFRLKKIAIIRGVEPAFLPTSGGTIHLIGVNFDASSTVTLNGVPAGSVTFVDSTLLIVNVAALGAAHYDVAVVNGVTGLTDASLPKSLTVESAPNESLEVPPGMAEGRAAAAEINLTHVDLQIDCPVGPDFVIARTHRSRHDAVGSPFNTPWDFSCNISVALDGADVVVKSVFLQWFGSTRRRDRFRRSQRHLCLLRCW